MADDVYNLYQELILDHNAHPHNFGELEGFTHTALGRNPLCGDEMALFLKINKENNKIADIKFIGEGCAIFKASASMMTDALIGKNLEEAQEIYKKFHDMLTLEENTNSAGLEKLAIFESVKQFPVRVKCATLAWHAFDSALKGQKETSTEQ